MVKKSKLIRRWRKARPGSVLILVIALLVLLALIGTAYLSSTQTERYTSHQNTINTEADLLIQGMVQSVYGEIAASLLGTGGQYRPASQEMPTVSGGVATNPVANSYQYLDSAVCKTNPVASDPDPQDLWMGDRIPGTYPSISSWNKISWPLFKDPSGLNTFDSPLNASINGSIHTGPGVNKGVIYCNPGSATLPDGSIGPTLTFQQTGAPVLNGDGTTFSPGTILAADTDGDGIADAGFVKVPVGQIDGVTYYVAQRIIDNNSAINVSSAWTQDVDTVLGANTNATNYGIFASNIGLKELLNQTATVVTSTQEINALNSYRFAAVNGTYPLPQGNPSAPTLSPNPTADASFTSPPTNFNWFSYGDALESQLTRRPGNPGLYAAGGGKNFQWLGLTQSAALAYKFTLVNPYLSQQPIEQLLPNELYYAAPTTPFSPSQVSSWYNSLFYPLNSYTGVYPAGSVPVLRPILTASNPVSNAVPARYGNASASTPVPWASGATYSFGDWVTDSGRSYVCMAEHVSSATNEPLNGKTNSAAVGLWAGAQNPIPNVQNLTPGMPWTTVPVKASINTAPFDQLWLNFCQVMTDSISPDPSLPGSPRQWEPPMKAIPSGTEPQLPMFRSTLRNATLKLSPSQMMKLRAALAAVNAMDLRDSDDDVTSQHIVLTDGTTSTANWYDVEVYGSEIQPFIGQVYIHNDTSTPANNFVAIQLLNPYDKPIIIQTGTATSWKFCTVDRSLIPNLTLTDLSVGNGPIAPGAVFIPARATVTPGMPQEPGVLVLTSSTTTPTGYAAPAGVVSIVVPGLATAIGKELMIMKPRRFDGQPSKLTPPAASPYFGDYYDEANASDLVPVDQVDTTGMAAAASGDFYYRRGSEADNPTYRAAWNFVYPGPYSIASVPPQSFQGSSPVSAANPNMGGYTYYDPAAAHDGSVATQATYTTVPVVINNTNMAGPNRLAGAGPFQFPFGGFARNGDMLQIPFIGSYRIRPYSLTPVTFSAPFTEMNSITMDSSLADDPLVAKPSTSGPEDLDYREQLGRFCWIGDPTAGTFDFATGTSAFTSYHYHWAAKLFDYFTVNAPSDDYYPNTDPAGATNNTVPAGTAKYPGGLLPVPVGNSSSSVTNSVTVNQSEDTIGVDGRININTAPMAVLAQIPFAGADTSPAHATAAQKAAQNQVIAQAIVTYRNAHGPFRSIFELYRVPAFLLENASIAPQTGAVPGTAAGIFSPDGIVPGVTVGDGVRYDFKERFILLNNISNLITTRSDTFTCYVLLQGWRNVGTSNPTLAVQRRAAFIVDRNNVTASSNLPMNFRVPTE